MRENLWQRRLFAGVTALVMTVGQGAASASDQDAELAPARAYEVLPMSFEPNVGQTDGKVSFLARGRGYTVFLTEDEVVLSLGRPRGPEQPDAGRGKHASEAARPEPSAPSVLRMRCAGTGPSAPGRIVGLEELPGKANYLIGDDPSRWHTDVPTFARVRYEGVYDGVDLDLYGNRQSLEYDFRVAPGADASQVRVRFDGAEEIRVDDSGELVLRMSDGEVRQQRAVVYQEDARGRQGVSARYTVTTDGEVGFDLGEYDAARMLVIDPVLVYSTYLGGSGDDSANAIAVDSTGATYVTGIASAGDFPVVNPIPGMSPYPSSFVTKMNPAGTALAYSTYLGGSDGNPTASYAIAVDGSGAAYVAGGTSSTNFPTWYAFHGYMGGGQDGFVTKLSAAGNSIVYSTYIGGSNLDSCSAIAVDGTGAAYVTGTTMSGNFPLIRAIQPTLRGGYDAFLVKMFPTGGAPYFTTYLGGSGTDHGNGVAADASGVYVTGYTRSVNFPTLNAVQYGLSGFSDAFVTKLHWTGTAFIYSTFLGGTGDEYGSDVAVDGAGAAYVTGSTGSTIFPTANPFQVSYGGSDDAFVAKLSAAGNGLVYSTYLGGLGAEFADDIAVDGAGAAYVTGYTGSTNFPTENPIQAMLQGSSDAFVTKLTPGGTALAYSTYLGGSLFEQGQGVAVDGAGATYVAGWTASNDFPLAGPFQQFPPGFHDAFVAKLPVHSDTLQFNTSGYTVAEGGAATVTVTRAGNNNGTITVGYATSDGTATATAGGGDYTPASGTLVFAAGTRTQSFTVQTAAGTSAQGNRALLVTLSAPSGGAALGAINRAPVTIVDDDTPASGMIFSSTVYTAGEGSVATVSVTRPTATKAQSVRVTTSNGTAQAGSDYTTVTQTVRFEVGVTKVGISIPTLGDGTAEGVETVHVALSHPTAGATLGARRTTVLTINDAPGAP
jgi:hypothetical protein